MKKRIPGRATRYSHAINEAKRRILVIALRGHPTCRAAADWLGVSASTVSRDCRLLGIRITRTTSIDVRDT